MDVEIVVDGHALVGEGAIWDSRTERLVWVDILNREVHQYDPTSGADTVTVVDDHPGTVVPRASGGFVLAVPEGFVALDLDGQTTGLAEAEADRAGSRMNDGKCDGRGRLWAGTMSYEYVAGAGSLYRLDPDLRVHTMLTGVTISNGVGWSLDDHLMYYIDSPTHRVDVFDYDPDSGAISNRRPLVEISPELGIPDGMTVDADGYLWVAVYGGSCVQGYAPDGRFDREIKLPASQITSCAFGGPELTDLYVTSAAQNLSAQQLEQEPHAGALFRIRTDVKGRPANSFSG